MGCIASRLSSTSHPRVAPPRHTQPPQPDKHHRHLNHLEHHKATASSAEQSEPQADANEPPQQPSPPTPGEPPPPPPPPDAKALLRALKAGNVDSAAACLDGAPALLERRYMWDNTPLLIACHYGHARLALLLVERGADTSAVNEHGCSALLYSCVGGLDGVVEALVEKPATELSPPPAPVYSRVTDQTSERTPLSAAAEGGYSRAVAAILAALSSRGVSAVTGSSLVLASSRGHASVCEHLLRESAAVPEEALVGAVRGCHVPVLQLLLPHSAPDGAAVSAAICAKPAASEAIRLLARAGASVNEPAPQTGDAPLHLAARLGLEVVATALLDAGADPTSRNANAERPADVAASSGRTELARLLEDAALAAGVKALAASAERPETPLDARPTARADTPSVVTPRAIEIDPG